MPAVRHQAGVLWPWFVAMMPVAGVLFALDGVFFGAGDLAFMRSVTLLAALGGFLPLVLVASVCDLGLGGIWAALAAFIGDAARSAGSALALPPLARGGHADGRRHVARPARFEDFWHSAARVPASDLTDCSAFLSSRLVGTPR